MNSRLSRGRRNKKAGAVNPRFRIDWITAATSAFIVGKKRKTTRRPKITGVGVFIRHDNMTFEGEFKNGRVDGFGKSHPARRVTGGSMLGVGGHLVSLDAFRDVYQSIATGP